MNTNGVLPLGASGGSFYVRRIGEENRPGDRRKGHKPRRRVAERTFGWLFECRALLARYDKHWRNYLGLLQLACGLLRLGRRYRLQAA